MPLQNFVDYQTPAVTAAWLNAVDVFMNSHLLYMPNALINGGMEVWQRNGTAIGVPASSAAYTVDRWVLTTNVDQLTTITKNPGLTAGSQWSAAIQRNGGQTGIGSPVFEQPFALEEIVKHRGQTLAVSFYISTGPHWSPTNGTINVNLLCGTGSARRRGFTAYTDESSTLAGTFDIAPSTSAQLCSATATAVVPTNTTQMSLVFSWAPTGTAGVSDYFSLDDVMMVNSTAITTYARRDFTDELAKCQRYYCKTFDYATAPAEGLGTGLAGQLHGKGVSASTLEPWANWRFPVEMITTPTVVLFNPRAGGASGQWATSASDSANVRVIVAGSGGVAIDNGGTALTAGAQYFISATAVAEL